jgi:hypothetical protein
MYLGGHDLLLFRKTLDRNSELVQDCSLDCPHPGLIVFLYVVVPEQVEQAMDDQQLQLVFDWVAGRSRLRFRSRVRDQHISQIRRAGIRIGVAGRKG